jgi:hypothetical protein
MDFRLILDELKIAYAPDAHRHSRAGWIQIDCPFCGNPGESKYHMGYNIANVYMNCWSCGPKRIGDTLNQASGVPMNRVLALLKGITKGKTAEKVAHAGKLKEPKGIMELQKAVPHQRYLDGRGFDPEEICYKWKVAAIGMHAQLKWRLYIPILLKGQVVSWTTRSINDKGLRYISASEEEEAVPHKTLLYGEDYCRQAIVVCEGPTDVWRIGPGAVATMGTSVTSDQLARISRYPVRAICFDNANAAQRRANELATTLCGLPGETYNIEIAADDPGSMTPEEVVDLRKNLKL